MSKAFDFGKEYKFGIEAIDKEHIKLVDMLNEVREMLATGKRAEARKYFKKNMVEYINTHFANEEIFLAKIGYPDLEEHKKVHIAFKESFNSLMPSIDSSDEKAFRKALVDGYNWLISHIGTTDRKYADYYLSEQGK